MTLDVIRIGDLSRITGLPVATLRYYESEGLIACLRTRSRYRMFSPGTIDVVRKIVHLKSLKLPLSEIRRILAVGEQPEEEHAFVTPEHSKELRQRLSHILERKSVWEEQERKVRQLLEALPAHVQESDAPGRMS